jgi:hypothetical protein
MMKNFAIALVLLCVGLISATTYAQAPQADGKARDKADNPACLEAMQIIGHDGEDVLKGWGGDDLETNLKLASIADSLVRAAKDVAANDGAYCRNVVATIPRIYPPDLDKRDHMSTGRLITTMNMLRIVAADKPRLEKELNKDISH